MNVEIEIGNLYKIRDSFFDLDINREYDCYGLTKLPNDELTISCWDVIEYKDTLLCITNEQQTVKLIEEYWEEPWPFNEMFDLDTSKGFVFLSYPKRTCRGVRLILLDGHALNELEDLLPVHPG